MTAGNTLRRNQEKRETKDKVEKDFGPKREKKSKQAGDRPHASSNLEGKDGIEAVASFFSGKLVVSVSLHVEKRIHSASRTNHGEKSKPGGSGMQVPRRELRYLFTGRSRRPSCPGKRGETSPGV